MSKIALFYGTQTGNTEELAGKIQEEFGGDDVVAVQDIADASADDFQERDLIVNACPNWNVGELQADWEGFYD